MRLLTTKHSYFNKPLWLLKQCLGPLISWERISHKTFDHTIFSFSTTKDSEIFSKEKNHQLYERQWFSKKQKKKEDGRLWLLISITYYVDRYIMKSLFFWKLIQFQLLVNYHGAQRFFGFVFFWLASLLWLQHQPTNQMLPSLFSLFCS